MCDDVSLIVFFFNSAYMPLPEWATSLQNSSQRRAGFATGVGNNDTVKKVTVKKPFLSSSSSSSGSSSSSSSESSESEEDDGKNVETKTQPKEANQLNEIEQVMTLAAAASSTLVLEDRKTHVMLSEIKGKHLLIEYCFPRAYLEESFQGAEKIKTNARLTPVTFRLTNKSLETSKVNIAGASPRLDNVLFSIPCLLPQQQVELTLPFDFGGKWRHPIRFFVLVEEEGKMECDISAPIGETFVIPALVQVKGVKQLKSLIETTLGGMYENAFPFSSDDLMRTSQQVVNLVGVVFVGEEEGVCFLYGQRADSSLSDVIVRVLKDSIVVNCDDALASIALTQEIKSQLVK